MAADREAHAPIAARGRAHALLRRNPLFAPLPLTALDRLAESLVPVSYGESEVVMREGDPGDVYVLIEHGEVDVSAEGRSLGTCGPGDGVGEIALLQRVPRTATVVARTLSRGTRSTPRRSSQRSQARPQPLRLRPLRRGGSNAPKPRANLEVIRAAQTVRFVRAIKRSTENGSVRLRSGSPVR